MPFTCSICDQESTKICLQCTKDTCGNHLCAKCNRCSDCCGCDVPLTKPEQAPVEPPAAVASIGGTEPLPGAEPLAEPAGVPAEDVPGEASNVDLPGGADV